MTSSTSNSAPEAVKKPRRQLAPGLLKAADAAAYCACSRSSWDRAAAAGLTPSPVRIAGILAWSRVELSAWIRHSCPERKTWSKLWLQLRDRRK